MPLDFVIYVVGKFTQDKLCLWPKYQMTHTCVLRLVSNYLFRWLKCQVAAFRNMLRAGQNMTLVCSCELERNALLNMTLRPRDPEHPSLGTWQLLNGLLSSLALLLNVS